MIEIKGKNANELFIKIAKALLKSGHRNMPRGLKTLELSDVWLTLDEPVQSVCTLPARGINMEYLRREMDWYLSGSTDVGQIEKASSFWSNLANENGTVNSNYGKLALKDIWAGRSQYQWCVDRLKKDSNSRQAVINYNQPVHKFEGNKDFVCTLAQQFVKRNGRLDSITLMRSNDLIFGLTYDLPWFTKLQLDVARDVGIPVGKYIHYAVSLHVYAKHMKMLQEMAKSK